MAVATLVAGFEMLSEEPAYIREVSRFGRSNADDTRRDFRSSGGAGCRMS